MRLFHQFTAVFEAELRSYVREVGPLAFMAVAPMLFSTLTYGIGSVLTDGAAEPEKWFFQLVGFAVMTTSIVMTTSAAWYFRRGMMSGRLEYAMASPTNPMVLVAANSLANVLASLMAFLFTALLGSYFVYGVGKILNTLAALLLTFIALLPVVGVNLIVGAATIAMKEPEPVANSITAVIAATSGFVYPITLLPPILQYIGIVLPYHHVVETARAAIVSAVTPNQLLVIAMMLFYLVAGLYVYRAGETHYARKTGIHW